MTNLRAAKLDRTEDVAARLMQGASTQEILEEFSITRYRLRAIKLTLAENELRVLRTEVQDLRAMNSTLSRQLTQMRDLHNSTRDDVMELGRAATTLLEHPMMDALRLFADKGKRSYQKNPKGN